MTKINILVHYRRLHGSKSENNKHLSVAVWRETNRLYYTHVLTAASHEHKKRVSDVFVSSRLRTSCL